MSNKIHHSDTKDEYESEEELSDDNLDDIKSEDEESNSSDEDDSGSSDMESAEGATDEDSEEEQNDQPLFFIDKEKDKEPKKFTKSGTKLESGLSTSKTYIVEPNKLLSKSKTKKLTDTKSKFIKDVSRSKSAMSLRDLMSSAVPSTSNSTKLNVDDLLTDVGCPDIIKKSVITPDFEKKHQVDSYETRLRDSRKRRKRDRVKTKGSGWYNMSAPEMTEELQNDLEVLRMRGALGGTSKDLKTIPKYFHVGTIVEDASEYYSARLPKKQRRKTLVDELLADREFRSKSKAKCAELAFEKRKQIGAYRKQRTYSRKVK